MKKKSNTGSGGTGTTIRERTSGIFWEAEADIIRSELLMSEASNGVRNERSE